MAITARLVIVEAGDPAPEYLGPLLAWLLDAAGALVGALLAARFGFLGFASLSSLLLAILAANAVTMATLSWAPSLTVCGGQYVFPLVVLWWLLDVELSDVLPCLGIIVIGRVLARLVALLVVVAVGAA